MRKRFCDRCKEELKNEEDNYIKIVEDNYKEEKCEVVINKELCKSCMEDLVNMVNFECNRYTLKTEVIEK